MSNKPTIVAAMNGPLLVTNCKMLKNYSDGTVYETDGTVALCRCGGSKKKPFCDGHDQTNGFTGDKAPGRTPDKRKTFEGDGVTVHDNRGICAHAGRCTDGLPSVFRTRQEPFVDPQGASANDIIETVKSCPSGALSYAVDGVEHRDQTRDPVIFIAPNGPYAIIGGADLQEVEWGEGASQEHFELCRCGASTNKPFCSGAHWSVQFDEHARKS
ncbi:MAG: CDGSH iron-sulfur domain-containing protein [Vicinamibacterales bacterium]|jgi:CDGSH-type Zn-finger protein|nr:hypothetical protein [Acidobacteriota bacterium]MDP7295043.1 CDGSH iron-sulfur domain-containing protein [Vicinamibacterales bacterium]MDP7473263.1 CDGSH iron-sulfur domain-containing protein [Vicinamibacterales bacterium]MDP7671327.1 CDGSH iron-sulfur domain-containing protein [Vicinamibacterales bacterium]HJO38553.1 CDGSH iron-sulfur domain-containing protein [Vicinamibacterales bacterium]|tara:strand:+ start:196 stop:837 length:642 start_codon:yes stop_codon:yes gene_type:complete